MRYRHETIAESIAQLEDRVATNTAELDQMRQSYDEDEDDVYTAASTTQSENPPVTDDDIEQEMAEIRELERRRRTLEERVTGMDRDLGGLIS